MIIEFEITKGLNTFKDALILDDNHIYSDSDIEAIQQHRFDYWYGIITNPVEVVWQTDLDGNQVLDENGNPIPVEG